MESTDSNLQTAALTDGELEELIAADQELISGPWLVWDDGDIGTAYPVERLRRPSRRSSEEPILETVESLWLLNGSSPLSDQLVAIRNGLPGLLERLRIAEIRVRELEEELKLAGTPF